MAMQPEKLESQMPAIRIGIASIILLQTLGQTFFQFIKHYSLTAKVISKFLLGTSFIQ